MVLIEEAGLEEASRAAERISEGLAAPFALGATLPGAGVVAGDEAGGEIAREAFVSASVG